MPEERSSESAFSAGDYNVRMLPRMLANFAPPTGSPFELAAEAIAVKIRWVGLVVGFLPANFGPAGGSVALNVMLGFGIGFTALNTAVFRGGCASCAITR